MKALHFIVYRSLISVLISILFISLSMLHAQEAEELPYDIQNVTAPSAESGRLYVSGSLESDFQKAITLLIKADSAAGGFPMAQIQIAYLYNNWAYDGNTAERKKEAKKWAQKAYNGRNTLSTTYRLYMEAAWCEFEKKPRERIKWIKKVIEEDPKLWEMWFNLGWTHWRLGEYKQAVEPLEKTMVLSIQYNSGISASTWMLGLVYHLLGEHKKELEVYEKIPAPFNEHIWILSNKASAHFIVNDIETAKKYVSRLQDKWKEMDVSDAQMANNLGSIYDYADMPEQAEKYYRQAVTLEPKNAEFINDLAYLLIDKDINVNEGVELIQKSHKIDPNNFDTIDKLGWGLYKQGKIEQALQYLEQAEDLAPKFEHDINKHLKTVRAAM
jgi:tetratricopeptide (TPR) repeat protein